jgi:hypothetical protein
MDSLAWSSRDFQVLACTDPRLGCMATNSAWRAAQGRPRDVNSNAIGGLTTQSARGVTLLMAGLRVGSVGRRGSHGWRSMMAVSCWA